MITTDPLEFYRTQISEAILLHRVDTPPFQPLNISPWLAMSLMQKAIRRSRLDLALGAAATLLEVSPERFWRRALITAFEDVGAADIEVISLVTAAMKGKLWRRQIGGEWEVASFLVQRMANANKCRASDDLLDVCHWHPRFEHARRELSSTPILELMSLAAGSRPLPERALALWYAIGTVRCPSSVLKKKSGDANEAFDLLIQAGYSKTVVEITREGLRKSNCILCAFLPLLWREAEGHSKLAKSDEMPSEVMIGESPGWAYDTHVREGNRALRAFLTTDCETARWVNAHIPKAKVKFLGGVLFRIESGLMAKRFHWPEGLALKRMADVECFTISPESTRLLMEMLCKDLPLLDAARAEVVVSNV